MIARLPPPGWIERWTSGVLRQRPAITHRQLVMLFRPAIRLYEIGVSAKQAALVVTGAVPRLVHQTERHETARKLKTSRN